MKRFAALIVVLVISASIGQAQLSSGGSHVGLGLGSFSYTTSWYYYNSSAPVGSREHYPAHVLNRTVVFGYYESPSLFALGPLKTSLRGEFHVGVSGGTKEDWLPLGEQISGGGSTFGGAAGLKVSYCIASLPAVSIAPYVFPAFHFTLLNSDGKDVGTQFANRTEYQYAEGWQETVYGASLGVGLHVELTSIIIAPEYRFFLVGGAGTDWTPAGREPSDEGPGFGAFVIGVGFKL